MEKALNLSKRDLIDIDDMKPSSSLDNPEIDDKELKKALEASRRDIVKAAAKVSFKIFTGSASAHYQNHEEDHCKSF